MIEQNLYEIALPVNANNGHPYEHALEQWEKEALAAAGGFTRMPDAAGFWRDTDTGKVYADAMRGYRLACDDVVIRRLIQRAWSLFPDQLAFFVARIGSATIVYRPAQTAVN